MKKSDFIKNVLAPVLQSFADDPHPRSAICEAKYLLSIIEQYMLPPQQECKLIPDELRGGMRHSEVKREWDEESEDEAI